MYNKTDMQKPHILLNALDTTTVNEIETAYALALQIRAAHNSTADETPTIPEINNEYLQKKQDSISETQFQTILENIQTSIAIHNGVIYLKYHSLFGINTSQIERLLNHCAEFDGFHFDFFAQRLEANVAVHILNYLENYQSTKHSRCVLNLSENNLKNPDIMDALVQFISNAKSPWALIINKCKLNLTAQLAAAFKESQIYSLSVKNNQLDPVEALFVEMIINNSKHLESIDYSKNYFDFYSLSGITQTIAAHQHIQKVTMDYPEFFTFDSDQTSRIINSLLMNKQKLCEITFKNQKLIGNALNSKFIINQTNHQIQSITLENILLAPQALQSLLTHCTNLKKLFLYQCDLSNELLYVIASQLNHSGLETLCIHQADGLYAGQAKIFEAASQNKFLKKLELPYLNFNLIEKSDKKIPHPLVVQALEKLFRENKTLNELNIEACNYISDKESKKLAQILKKSNRSLSKLSMQNVIEGDARSIIFRQLYSNLPSLDVKKEIPQIQGICFSKEAFNYLLIQVNQLMAKQLPILKLPIEKNPDNIYGRLAPQLNNYLSKQQLNDFMDTALKGNFSGIDFSSEKYMPSEYNGLILSKIHTYYTSNSLNLYELNLANSDLCGQISTLIEFLNHHTTTLKKLILTNAKMQPQELLLLLKTINDLQLDELAIPDCGYKVYNLPSKLSSFDSSFKGVYTGGNESSIAIANMLDLNQTLFSFSLTCTNLTKNELAAVFTSLENNKTIKSLAINVYYDFADEAMARLLEKNSNIKELILKGNCYSFHNTLSAALNSPWLQKLSLKNFSCHSIQTISIQDNINSQLSEISLKNCDVNNIVLKRLSYLPLIKLNLSNNRLFADLNGAQLLKLIQSTQNSLEELNLSGNFLATNQNKDLGLDSHFLASLGEYLKNCSKLKILHLNTTSHFLAHDMIKFVRQLTVFHPSLEKINYEISDGFVLKNTLTKEIGDYCLFLLDQKSVKESEINAFFKKHIEKTIKNISKKIQHEKYGNSWDCLLGKKPNVAHLGWGSTIQEILNLVQKGDFASFHTHWEQYDKNNLDIYLRIMFDWLDEIILLNAKKIKFFNLTEPGWASVYQHEMNFPGYEIQLDAIELIRVNEEQDFNNKWNLERSEKYNTVNLDKNDSKSCMKRN